MITILDPERSERQSIFLFKPLNTYENTRSTIFHFNQSFFRLQDLRFLKDQNKNGKSLTSISTSSNFSSSFVTHFFSVDTSSSSSLRFRFFSQIFVSYFCFVFWRRRTKVWRRLKNCSEGVKERRQALYFGPFVKVEQGRSLSLSGEGE